MQQLLTLGNALMKHIINIIVQLLQQKFCVDAGSYSVGDRVKDALLEALLKEFFQMQDVKCVVTRN